MGLDEFLSELITDADLETIGVSRAELNANSDAQEDTESTPEPSTTPGPGPQEDTESEPASEPETTPGTEPQGKPPEVDPGELDQFLKNFEPDPAATTAPKDISIVLQEQEAAIKESEAAIAQQESILNSVTPYINIQTGVELPKYQTKDGQNVLEMGKDQVDHLINQLDAAGDRIEAAQIRDAWVQYQNNKQAQDALKKQLSEQRQQLNKNKDITELGRVEAKYTKYFQQIGFEMTQADWQTAIQYMTQRGLNDAAYRDMSREQQFVEALKGTPIRDRLRDVGKKATQGATAPDKGAGNKTVVTNKSNVVDMETIMRKDPKDLTKKELDAMNDWAISEAMKQVKSGA